MPPDDALLGLLHGPAELLPISSSAHVALAHADPARGAEIALHAGSAAALAVGRRGEIAEAARNLNARRIAVHLLAGGIPAAAGWVLRDRLTLRRSPVPGLLLGSAALALADGAPQTRDRWDARPADGLALGLAQAVALVPGISRNGATLAAARARGFTRPEANALSREVGLPVTLGAVAVAGRGGSARGLAASFFSTLAALPLLRVVDRAPLWPWAAYRCVLALALMRGSRR
jgi:undecaprenyl-diphosphatase